MHSPNLQNFSFSSSALRTQSDIFTKLGAPKISVINTLKNKNGEQTKTVKEALMVAEDHFATLFKIPEEKRGKKRKFTEKGKEGKPIPKELRKKLTEAISRKELENAVKKLKNGKAAGPDGIPNELIKAGGRYIRIEIQNLFN